MEMICSVGIYRKRQCAVVHIGDVLVIGVGLRNGEQLNVSEHDAESQMVCEVEISSFGMCGDEIFKNGYCSERFACHIAGIAEVKCEFNSITAERVYFFLEF